MKYEEMIKLAAKASENAYVPYSKFPVGACVLAESGNVYTGCNFENSSYGMTICGERNAIGTAIAAGERKIRAVAIYSPKMKYCVPCGACRQVMSEFVSSEGLDIILETDDGIVVKTLQEMLPDSLWISAPWKKPTCTRRRTESYTVKCCMRTIGCCTSWRGLRTDISCTGCICLKSGWTA